MKKPKSTAASKVATTKPTISRKRPAPTIEVRQATRRAKLLIALNKARTSALPDEDEWEIRTQDSEFAEAQRAVLKSLLRLERGGIAIRNDVSFDVGEAHQAIVKSLEQLPQETLNAMADEHRAHVNPAATAVSAFKTMVNRLEKSSAALCGYPSHCVDKRTDAALFILGQLERYLLNRRPATMTANDVTVDYSTKLSHAELGTRINGGREGGRKLRKRVARKRRGLPST